MEKLGFEMLNRGTASPENGFVWIWRWPSKLNESEMTS